MTRSGGLAGSCTVIINCLSRLETVAGGNSAVPVILSLIAAGVIAFALWFMVENADQGDGVVPDVSVTSSVGS